MPGTDAGNFERALRQREVDHHVECGVRVQRPGDCDFESRDAREAAGILTELLVPCVLERGGELELRVGCDELDESRAHAARCAMDADLESVFTHDSCSFRYLAVQGVEAGAASVAE